MKYREELGVTEKYKKEYLAGLEHIIKCREREAEAIRKEYTKDIFSKQPEYRDRLKQMLGWPLAGNCGDKTVNVRSELLSQEDGYEILRMQFEIAEGLNMTGLFFRQTGCEKAPLVIAQHGGLGTPEVISGVYGSTSNYNNMLHRIREKGVHVFAPQLLLWNETYGVDFDRKHIDARLKRVGSSITAIEAYGITKILDYFETKEYVTFFGMAGLSYGGFFTLYVAAIDTRIKSAISCSFFNKRDEVAWPDWTWLESAQKFDDAEVACLVYPRKLQIYMGNKDELFDYRYSRESFDRIKEMCKDVGTDWVEFEVFDGNHEFFKNDEPIQKLISDITNV